jgi:hypothetical protein
LVIHAGGQDQLIINTTERADAVDPASGKPLWHAGEPNRVPVPTPVFAGGMLYLNRGYSSGPYMALRPGGKIEWEVRTGAPDASSLLHHEGLLHMANERGIVAAADSKDGTTYVLAAGREKRVLAENRLGERILASPAVSGGRIFLRSDQNL